MKTKRQIKPFGDRVLVKPFTEEDLKGKKNSFGIIIPDTVSKEKSAQGKVLAVGDGKKIKVGDTVIFSKYSYDEVEYEGEELYLIKEENILAIIK
ncbi:MAG: co-chaperone GroES [Candidatus Zambryskibacteria bacterium]|nr:co-chaperone GroES [Candidatus Zambryskibacteria bacterium]